MNIKQKFEIARAGIKAAKEVWNNVPDDLWRKCPGCKQIIFTKELLRALQVCPKCGHHIQLGLIDRLEYTLDPGTFVEFDSELNSVDPIQFPGYAAKLDNAQAKTGKNDGFTTGTGQIMGIKVVIGIADFAFMGGSMGSVTGEKVVRAVEYAIEQRLPVVFFTTSGGARMQEGTRSLMQMAKTCEACQRLSEVGLPYIAVLTDPTTAGTLASYATVAHFILAEPKARVGFAGGRVADKAQGAKKPPENYQTAEFQLGCGMVDQIVHRKDMRSSIAFLLRASFKEETND